MNKKPSYVAQKVAKHQNSFKGYVNPNSCFSPSRKQSGHFVWSRNRRIYRWYKIIKKFLERKGILTKAKSEEVNGMDSGEDSTPRARAALQNFGDELSVYSARDLFTLENTKLGLSALGLLVLNILGQFLKKVTSIHQGKVDFEAVFCFSNVLCFYCLFCCFGGFSQKLLVEAQYGDDLHAFPPYTDFLCFVNSLGACVVALLYFAVSQISKKMSVFGSTELRVKFMDFKL